MANNTTIQFPTTGKTALAVTIGRQVTNLSFPVTSNKTTVTSAVHGPAGPKGDTGDSNWRTEIFTLTGTDVFNKYVDLLVPPTGNVFVDMVGGIRQFLIIDFVVTGNRLSWANLGMEPLVENGQVISVQYQL